MTESIYTQTRNQLLACPSIITSVEHYATNSLYDLISKYKDEIEHDYNSASDLAPYWKNYPPDDRGRQPRGDQVPWIEVGEHAVGDNLLSHINELGAVKFPGIPAGPDIRYTVSSSDIADMSDNLIQGLLVNDGCKKCRTKR